MTITSELRPTGRNAAQLSFAEFQQLSVAEQAAVVRARPAPPMPLLTQLRVLFMLGRPRTCIPGLLAYVLGFSYTGAATTPWLILGAVQAFLIGFSANLHNTYTDLEEDCRNLPGRVWLYAQLGARRMFWTLVVINAFVVGSALLISVWFAIVALFAAVGLHQYSFRPFRFKAMPIIGLYVFAQAVGFPFLYGWLTAVPARPLTDSPAAIAMLAFLVIWFIAKGTFKNVPDYYGDKAAGLRTSATVFPSWRSAATFSAGFTILAYLLPLGLVLGDWSPVRMLLVLVFVPIAVVQCVRLVQADDGAAGNAILRTDMLVSSAFLASVLLLQAPRWESVVACVLGAAVLFLTDLLSLDSRRDGDAAGGTPTTDPASQDPAAAQDPTVVQDLAPVQDLAAAQDLAGAVEEPVRAPEPAASGGRR